jgi:hypothetical protein
MTLETQSTSIQAAVLMNSHFSSVEASNSKIKWIPGVLWCGSVKEHALVQHESLGSNPRKKQNKTYTNLYTNINMIICICVYMYYVHIEYIHICICVCIYIYMFYICNICIYIQKERERKHVFSIRTIWEDEERRETGNARMWIIVKYTRSCRKNANEMYWKPLSNEGKAKGRKNDKGWYTE